MLSLQMLLVTSVLAKPGEDTMVSSPDQYCPSFTFSYHCVLSLTLFWFLSVRLIVPKCYFLPSRSREQPQRRVPLFQIKVFSRLLDKSASSLSCSTNQLPDQSAARPISRRAGWLNSFQVIPRNTFLLKYALRQRGRDMPIKARARKCQTANQMSQKDVTKTGPDLWKPDTDGTYQT